MKGGPRVVTDKMLELEHLVGPPIKDEVEPWTRGVEPAASQKTSGWTAVHHRPYKALGVPVLAFEAPLTILRAQEAVSNSALPEVEELLPPPPPVSGAIPVGQRNAGKTLRQQAKLSAVAVQRCKAGGLFYDTLSMQGLRPPRAGDTPAGGVEAVKERLEEMGARERDGVAGRAVSPSSRRSHARARTERKGHARAAGLGDAHVARKLAAEATAKAEARRLAAPRGSIAGRRFHTYVHRDRAAAPLGGHGHGGDAFGYLLRLGTSSGAGAGGFGGAGASRPGTSGSIGLGGPVRNGGVRAGPGGSSRPSTAATALTTIGREGWMHLFAAPGTPAVVDHAEGAPRGGVGLDPLQLSGSLSRGGGGNDSYGGSDHCARDEDGNCWEGSMRDDECRSDGDGGGASEWGDSFVAGTAAAAAVAAAREIRTHSAANVRPGSRGEGWGGGGVGGGSSTDARSRQRPTTGVGAPPGLAVEMFPSTASASARQPNTNHKTPTTPAVGFGRRPPSSLPRGQPRTSTAVTGADTHAGGSETKKPSSWTETMFGATLHTVKPPEDTADKVAMANFAFLSIKHTMDAGLMDTLERLTKDRAGLYALKSAAFNDTSAHFRFPSDLSREIPSARTHAEMLATRAAIQRVEQHSWYKKLYAHVASQIRYDGLLLHGEQHIITAITRILVDGHRFTRNDLRRILCSLDPEDHFNMDVQKMVRLLVNNLGVTREEYEGWFGFLGRASVKEIMRHFDKGVQETRAANASINAVRFITKVKKSVTAGLALGRGFRI